MDNICIRFSHLSERIFDSLDNENLNNCKEASRFWFHFLDGQKFVQIRIIKATVGQFHSIGKSWNKVFNSASTETIMVLGDAINQFYKKGSDLEYYDELTPMHTAAATGDLFLLTKIQEKSLDNHPKDDEGCTPLYYAAQNGHLEVCEHIIEKIEDKNPARKDRRTPLHTAAYNGNLKVCKLIIKNLGTKNPKDNHGFTPLHKAAQSGRREICELLMKDLEEKKSYRQSWHNSIAHGC